MDNLFAVSGAISGALNRDSLDALEHAEQYYFAVRKMKTDVAKIARNTGVPRRKIKAVKRYVFIDEHELEDGLARFAPDYDMAQSWQRLIQGGNAIRPLDLLLIEHELLEMSLVKVGYSQEKAHIAASAVYNYNQSAEEWHNGQNN